MSAALPRRILIVRSAIEDFYEPSWVRALRDNGHEVELFDTFSYLTRAPVTQGTAAHGPLKSPDRLGWWQHRLLWGPRVTHANQALIAYVRRHKPDVVLMYLGHHYHADTIRRLREHTFVTLFHSDDPFGPRSGHPRYRLLRRALPWYHGAHFYRPHTAQDAARHGVQHSATLLDFYRPWDDFPRGGALEHEVVFIGHFEPDLRVQCLVQAARAGLPVRIFSHEPGWRRALPRDVCRVVGPWPGLYGDAYRQKLSRAKVSLCFLSRWNRDVYTRRVFEVPACGGFLLCERTELMETLYREGKEAEFFASADELVAKLRYYLSHEVARSAIARAGHARVVASGHDIHSRLRTWVSEVAAWREQARLGRCAS